MTTSASTAGSAPSGKVRSNSAGRLNMGNGPFVGMAEKAWGAGLPGTHAAADVAAQKRQRAAAERQLEVLGAGVDHAPFAERPRHVRGGLAPTAAPPHHV